MTESFKGQNKLYGMALVLLVSDSIKELRKASINDLMNSIIEKHIEKDLLHCEKTNLRKRIQRAINTLETTEKIKFEVRITERKTTEKIYTHGY